MFSLRSVCVWGGGGGGRGKSGGREQEFEPTTFKLITFINYIYQISCPLRHGSVKKDWLHGRIQRRGTGPPPLEFWQKCAYRIREMVLV